MGQEALSDWVVKGTNSKFNDHYVKESSSQFWHGQGVKRSNDGSKILTDGHGYDYSIYGSDHSLVLCC